MNDPRRAWRSLAALLAALACAASAGAQAPKPREATLGGSAATGPALNREQLRQCLVEQDALKGARDELARDAQAIDAEKSALARTGTTLKERFDALDKSDAAALQAHIDESKAHDERIDAFNAKLPAHAQRVAALRQRADTWKSGCADRPYREDDLILLQARKQVPAGAK